MSTYVRPENRDTWGRLFSILFSAFFGSFVGVVIPLVIVFFIARARLNDAAEQYKERMQQQMKESPPRLRTLEEFERARERKATSK